MEKQEQQSPAEKQNKLQAKQTRQNKSKRKRRRKQSIAEKVIFFSFKWVFILFCLFIAVIAGLVVGFSIIGDGNAGEVFDMRMWKHLYDLVFNI